MCIGLQDLVPSIHIYLIAILSISQFDIKACILSLSIITKNNSYWITESADSHIYNFGIPGSWAYKISDIQKSLALFLLNFQLFIKLVTIMRFKSNIFYIFIFLYSIFIFSYFYIFIFLYFYIFIFLYFYIFIILYFYIFIFL